MSPTVSTACPKCRTTLHIPTEWTGKAVKCKQCGTKVQTNPVPVSMPYPPLVFDPTTGAYVPAPGYAPPPGYPYPMPAGPTQDFADLEEKRSRKKKKSSKGSGSALLGAFAAMMLLGIVGGAVVVVLTDNPLKDKLTVWLQGGSTTPSTPIETKPSTVVTPPVAKPSPIPRRMLAISITKYLYCNPLVGGKNKNDRSEFGEAVKALAFRWGVPDSKANNQLYVLTDADGTLNDGAAHRPMLKAIVSEAISQFCQSSREQDRVVIYFGGHAVVKNGQAYLVPSEGDLNEPDTLLPLDDFWAAVKACKAQQKVVLFDVCRLSTDDNAVRPGSEPMTPELEKLLHTPPERVQVMTSCSANQQAAEFRTADDGDTPQGSAFLGALRLVSRQTSATKVTSADPFPVAQWAAGVEKRLSELLVKPRVEKAWPCTPKLSGTEPPAVAANPDEPPPARLDYPPAPKGASTAAVKAVFTLLDLPPLLGSSSSEGGNLDDLALVFSDQAMKAYQPTTDDKPWRKATAQALTELRTKWKSFTSQQSDSVLGGGLDGKASDELKKRILKQQTPIADLSLELDDMVTALTGLRPQAENDESAYWRATFRYTLAQAKLRLAFSHEANRALGDVRTDSLPEGADGWKLVQVPRMKARAYASGAREAQTILDELAKEAKGTPWEVMAKQWRGVSLGLEWRVKKPDADTTMPNEKK